MRAAARAGLVAKVVKRGIESVISMELPVVAILEGDGACVVIERKGDASVLVMLPEAGGGVREVRLAELVQRQAGYVIFARPEYFFEPKGPDDSERDPRRWFWGVVAKSWSTYIHVAVAAAVINTFALVTPLFVMTVYDRVVPNNALDTLWVLSLGVVVVFGFEFSMRTLRAYFIDSAGKYADVALASRVFDHVLDLQMTARPASAGGFANTLREFETVREFFTSATLAALVDLPYLFLFIGVIAAVGGPLAWVPLLAVPIVVAGGLIIHVPLKRSVGASFAQAESKNGVLFETIGGLETIKTIGAEARMRGAWERSVAQSARAGTRSRMLSTIAMNFTALVQQIASVAIVIVGVLLIGTGKLSVGALVASTMLNGRAVGSLAQVAQILVRWHQARTSLKALDAVMRMPVERPRARKFLHRPTLEGRVEFRGVSFTYPGAAVAAVSDLSLAIRPGERVGLIGRVGSGKSTIQKLILGLYAPQQGSILIDGTELRQIDPIDLRRSIGAVPQDVFLFRGTVRENIVAGAPHTSDAQVLAAARIAGVDDFVTSHPMGYDLPVGERGEGLSGGQRQCISLARALLHDPSLLLLDEPTNAMDNAAEMTLRRSLEDVLTGRTLILVTHRTSLLALVDRLVVIDKGKVVADGPKQAVLDAIAGGRVPMVAA